jgi:lysophospholipase L1-like esterase
MVHTVHSTLRLLKNLFKTIRFQQHRLRSFGCLLGMTLFMGQCQSQFRPPEVAITDKDTVGYNFFDADENRIENEAYLEPLFKKLYLQRTQGGQKINIVHIGDSHILGNFLTRELRRRLQEAFGDAGRGLVFPYRLADSNGPRDYLTGSNTRWNGDNCQRTPEGETPFGISGFSIVTGSPNCELTFRMRDTTSASETKLFTKVTVFKRPSEAEFDLRVSDETTGQEAQPLVEGDVSKSFYFDRPVGQATITGLRKNGAQKRLTFDGVSIENEYSGVIYHSIGVNGATFSDFARARHFARQVADLNPDLIIFSFGTNEAQSPAGRHGLYRTIQALVSDLAERSPATRYLFTTPADSYLRGKGFNPYMGDISSVIGKYARDKGFALWDLHTFTGGPNSAQAWKTRGLMAHDSVHYSKAGYAVQGKLLYQSLMKGYNRYVVEQP